MSMLMNTPSGKPMSTLDQMIADHNVKEAAENVMLLVDVSGSMGEYVGVASRSKINLQKRRIDIMRRVVKDILKTRPQTPVLAFGLCSIEQCRLLTAGEELPEPEGGTPIGEAIRMAGKYGGKNLVILSDGGPDDPHDALAAAAAHGCKIDTVYIGGDSAGDPGAAFLRKLAKASGGSFGKDALKDSKKLTSTVIGLLGDGGIKGGPINL